MIGIVNVTNRAVNPGVRRNVTSTDLRCHCQTGRGYVVSGEGRNRIYGYKTGVQCDLGDIEVSEWCQMVRDLIEQAGEQDLYQQLLEYVKEHYLWLKSKREREHTALELHVARIFDDQAWVGFVEFNQKYRPEILAAVELVTVVPECCKKSGLMTRKRLESSPLDASENYCPHCGRWTQLEICSD